MCEIKEKLVDLASPIELENKVEYLVSYFDKINMKIPDDFIEFYKWKDGCKIFDINYMLCFKAPADFISKDVVRFSHFGRVEWMISEYEKYNDDFFPRGMIRFVDYPIGCIVISCREDSFGNVFFCETDLLPEQFIHPDYSDDIMPSFDYPNKPLPAAMFKVADSFTEFLNLLELTE